MYVSQVVVRGREDVAAQLASLADARPGWVLAFGPPERLRDVARVLEAMFPDAIRTGCTTAGEISAAGVTGDTCVVTVVRFRAVPLFQASTTLAGMADSHAAGGRLGVQLPAEGLRAVLLIGQGVSINGMADCQLVSLARNSWALGLAQEKFQSKFFANGGRIGGILELPLGMPKPSRDQLEEGFRKSYEGADNPFKTVVLRDNAKFHAAQQSPEDAQLVDASEQQHGMLVHVHLASALHKPLVRQITVVKRGGRHESHRHATASFARAIWLGSVYQVHVV